MNGDPRPPCSSPYGMPRRDVGAAATLAVVLAASLAGCAVEPAARHPRPALPLPAATAAVFALEHPVQVQALFVAGGDRAKVYWRGSLTCGDQRATFHLLLPRTAAPRPLVLCLPILAGGADLMWSVASGMAARGYAAAWVDRAAPALRDDQRGPELDDLFRRALRHNRMLLRWSERRADLFATGQRAILGISTGGLVGTVLLALEPSITAGALCLAGGDIPSLLRESAEGRVARWRGARARADGLGGSRLERELERELSIDPARFGAYVQTDRAFLVHAGLDDVVPERHHRLLWESLGRPRDLRLPWLGHYSAALALDAILDAVAEFVAGRCAANAGT